MLANSSSSFLGMNQVLGGLSPLRSQQNLCDANNAWGFGNAVSNLAWSETLARNSLVSPNPEGQAALLNYFNSQMQQLQRMGSVHASASSVMQSPATPSTVSDHSSTSRERTPEEEPSPKPTASNKIFPRRKAGQTFRINNKPVVLTEKVLRQYFDLPLHEAAVQLGISATAMKSACRKCGIKKWPYRTVSSKGAAAAAASSGSPTTPTLASSASSRRMPDLRSSSSDSIASAIHTIINNSMRSSSSSSSSSSPTDLPRRTASSASHHHHHASPQLWFGCEAANTAGSFPNSVASRSSPIPASPTDICHQLPYTHQAAPTTSGVSVAAKLSLMHQADRTPLPSPRFAGACSPSCMPFAAHGPVSLAAAVAAAAAGRVASSESSPARCVLSPLVAPVAAVAPQEVVRAPSSAGSLSSILN